MIELLRRYSIPLLFLLLACHIFLLTRIQFTAWPEMVLYPWLLNEGFKIYQDIINPYPPLLTFFLNYFYWNFGFSTLTLTALTYSLIIVVDLLIFFTALKIFKKIEASFLALVFFIFWQPFFEGNTLWFDLALLPFILFSFYFLILAGDFSTSKGKIYFLGSSFFWILAFFIKQSAIWYLLPIFFLIIQKIYLKKRNALEALRFLGLFLVIPIFFLLILSFFFWLDDNFSQFWYWSLYYPFLIMPQLPGQKLLPTFRQIILVLLPIIFLLPLFLKKMNFLKLFVFFLFSLFFFLPRFDLFHFQPALAFLSLTLPFIWPPKGTWIKFFLVFLLLISIVFQVRFYGRKWGKEVRFFESEIYAASEKIKQIVKEEKLYIQNGPTQLYFLMDKQPIKPWAAEFAWYLEVPGLQERIVRSLENENPKYVLFQPYEQGEKYEIGTYRPKLIADYVDRNYFFKEKIGETLKLLERR